VQHAESSTSRIHNQSSAQGDGDARDQEAPVHVDGAGGQPAKQGTTSIREWILDTRGQAHDGAARNVLNAKRRSDAEARAAAGYHPGGVVATPAKRIAHQRRNPWEPACSAGRSA
jgi:hypothetical protein